MLLWRPWSDTPASGPPSAARSSPIASPTPSLGPPGDITRYGARPGDGADDTEALLRAFAAYDTVYVPAGTFDVRSVTIPAGTTVTGAGWDSWLRGDVSIGGDRVTLRDLKIGKAGHNLEQSARTDDFLAERVRFTGGGEWPEPGGDAGPESHVVSLDGPGGDRIRFVACYFERNRTSVSDILKVIDEGGVEGRSYSRLLVKDCTFERSSFMALELVQRPPADPSTGWPLPNVKGYSVTVTGCTFAGADSQVVSFDSNPTTGGPYDHVEFSFNQVGPGGRDPALPYPHGIEVNNGVEAWMHHNTVAGSRGWMVNSDAAHKGDARQVWEHNTFDQTQGLDAERDGIGLVADDVTFRRNVVVFAGEDGKNVFYITARGVTLAHNTVTVVDGGLTLAYLDRALEAVFRRNAFTAPGAGVVLVGGATLLSAENVYETGLGDPFSVDRASRVDRRGDEYR